MCKAPFPPRAHAPVALSQAKVGVSLPDAIPPQLDANEAEPVFDEREGVDEYNEMPMPV